MSNYSRIPNNIYMQVQSFTCTRPSTKVSNSIAEDTVILNLHLKLNARYTYTADVNRGSALQKLQSGHRMAPIK